MAPGPIHKYETLLKRLSRHRHSSFFLMHQMKKNNLQTLSPAVNVLKLVSSSLINRVFVPGKTFQPNLIFVGLARFYLGVVLSGAPLYGRLLGLPIIIRQSWKELPSTNALAYFSTASVMKKKRLKTLRPDRNNIYKVETVKDSFVGVSGAPERVSFPMITFFYLF